MKVREFRISLEIIAKKLELIDHLTVKYIPEPLMIELLNLMRDAGRRDV